MTYAHVHTREIQTGLVLTLAAMAIAAVLAIIDPWENGTPWINWLVISLAATFSVTATTWCATGSKTESEFRSGLLATIIVWAIAGGTIIDIIASRPPASDSTYSSIAWSAYATPAIAVPISAMVQYLSGAKAEKYQQQRNLR